MNSKEAIDRLTSGVRARLGKCGIPPEQCFACTADRAALDRLEADARALADVRTLDEWAACEVACAERFEWTTSKMVPAHKGWRCVLRGITLRPVRDFTAPTPDEARAKAAEWVRKQAKVAK